MCFKGGKRGSPLDRTLEKRLDNMALEQHKYEEGGYQYQDRTSA